MVRSIHKIGDILEINIEGVITPCFIINLHEEYVLSYGDNVLLGPRKTYKITQVKAAAGFVWPDCCQLLIGDQKVFFLLKLI